MDAHCATLGEDVLSQHPERAAVTWMEPMTAGSADPLDQQLAARMAAGERVRVFTRQDGNRAVYTRAEAGLAWFARGGRQVGSVAGLVGLALVLLALIAGLASGAAQLGWSSSGGVACLVFAAVVLPGLSWLVVLLVIEIKARRLRRDAGLPAPV